MDRSAILARFLDGLSHPLYAYQEEALLAWFDDAEAAGAGGLLVCAPTGMGKTLLAEAAVFEALHSGQKLYYTTPLIALTDQKFRELQDRAEGWGFPRESIGLVTGNRRTNPDAPIRVVVAEILLNHLLGHGESATSFESVSAVVMDEFHSFNDPERGIVWELSLALLPRPVRVLLLSATVGNPYEFTQWLRQQHGRALALVTSVERRVPLEPVWVEDKLLTELLPELAAGDDSARRVPALVFAFNRDECWELAEKLKGLSLIDEPARTQIAALLEEHRDDLAEGVGPKLRQMLQRGVGVHHAGVLPKHKDLVEKLFLRKLVPFVACTETLAAGINLPARSVVLTTLLKGKFGAMTLIPSSTAHQICGRAGRPQFDTRGFVYAVAHEDDVKINKWKARYDKIDPNAKDPVTLRMRKEMERKRPTRRRTEQYWSEGQFKSLLAAGPARLASRGMLPYPVLVYWLSTTGSLQAARRFLQTRFTSPDRIEKFTAQLDFMVGNLEGLGYLRRGEDGQHVTLDDSIHRLLVFRGVDPLYGAFLAGQLARGSFEEKILALESVLSMPPAIERRVAIPGDLPPGPLQREVLEPLMVQMGIVAAPVPPSAEEEAEEPFDDEPEERPPTFPEMLKLVFEAQLLNPEPVIVQGKWVAGGAFAADCEFYKFVKSVDLVKQEGLILRHLLRLVILAGEFQEFTGDPDYARIGELATRTCHRVDPGYTDRFLSEAAEWHKL